MLTPRYLTLYYVYNYFRHHWCVDWCWKWEGTWEEWKHDKTQCHWTWGWRVTHYFFPCVYFYFFIIGSDLSSLFCKEVQDTMYFVWKLCWWPQQLHSKWRHPKCYSYHPACQSKKLSRLRIINSFSTLSASVHFLCLL